MLRICIIGAPPKAEQYFQIFKEFAEIVAIVENDYDYARKFVETYHLPVYPTHRDAMREFDFDAALVLVPSTIRYRVLQEVLSDGKHVLVDAPITDNLETAIRICNLAEYQGLLLSVAYLKRFNPAVLKARELIESGETGRMLSLQSTILTPGRFPDALDAFGPEELDVFRFIAGVDIGRISVILSQMGRVCTATMNFINDVNGVMHFACQSSVSIEELLINCEGQSLLVDYRNQNVFKVVSVHSDVDIELGLPEELKKERCEVVRENPMRLIVKNFVEALTMGARPLITGYESVRAMESYLAARHSANTGALVRLR
ncbi:MAG: Gfo/Idh/MocA family protein [Thermoplasmata archaeon]